MKKLIDYLSSELKVNNKIMLEKDILLHKFLINLTNNEYFSSNFAFKGGTCLTKCYLGYYRFSEDLDFTYVRQKEISKESQKRLRKILSLELNKIFEILVAVANDLNLDFKADKSNSKYVQLGGSNKFSTFKIWYNSEILAQEQFIKVQISFFDILTFPINKRNFFSILNKRPEGFEFLFPEEKSLFKAKKVLCYDIREILLEKFRAILTRRGIKVRDFIDIYKITKKEKIDYKIFRKDIIAKTRFMLRYEKYLQNLAGFKLKEIFLKDEEKLLLEPLPKDFNNFIKELQVFLEDIADELQRK